MSLSTTSEYSRISRLDLVLALAGAATLATVLGLTCVLSDDLGQWLTRNTVRLSLAWYVLALVTMLELRPSDWLAQTDRGRLARWFWSWGVICFLVHLAMAFNFYHRWSHAEAFEHTRQVGGVGEGIYLSYLFTVLWVTDAAWWWMDPASYAARSVWLDRALHGFMLFMVFNGTIVFESGAIRWAGIVSFAALAGLCLRAQKNARLRSRHATL